MLTPKKVRMNKNVIQETLFESSDKLVIFSGSTRWHWLLEEEDDDKDEDVRVATVCSMLLSKVTLFSTALQSVMPMTHEYSVQCFVE